MNRSLIANIKQSPNLHTLQSSIGIPHYNVSVKIKKDECDRVQKASGEGVQCIISYSKADLIKGINSEIKLVPEEDSHGPHP